MSENLQKFFSAECKDPDDSEIQKENAELIEKKTKQNKKKNTWIKVQWLIIASLAAALLFGFFEYYSKIDDSENDDSEELSVKDIKKRFESLKTMNAELDEMTKKHADLSLLFKYYEENDKIVLELTKPEFEAQLKRIQDHNKDFEEKKTSFKLGLNSLSGIDPEHFKSQFLMKKHTYENETEVIKAIKKHHKKFKQMPERIIPIKSGFETSLDWTTDNNPLKKQLVTAVKNQGSCGSCYAFSAAVAIEANICGLGHKSCSRWSGVSEQYMLNCGKGINEDSCSGGFSPNMLAFSRRSGVLDSEQMPYTSGFKIYLNGSSDGLCDSEKKNFEEKWVERTNYTVPETSSHKFNQDLKKNFESIKQILKTYGPVMADMYVDNIGNTMNYQKGVYIPDNNCGYHGDYMGIPYFHDHHRNDRYDDIRLELEVKSTVNHALAIVGYGFEENESGEKVDYWIVKNSWGSDWGEHGYMKFAAGKNYCGIETYINFFENRF